MSFVRRKIYKLLLLIAISAAPAALNAQGAKYVKQDSIIIRDGVVTLYAKLNKFSVQFKAVNMTSGTVHCVIKDVAPKWQCGDSVPRDVWLISIPPGKVRRGSYDLSDSFSRMPPGWVFSGWSVESAELANQ